MRILKILHHWFPRLCARDSPLVFIGNEIRCPVCGRLLAYRYLAPHRQGGYCVHVCYPFAFDPTDVKMAANRDPPDLDSDPYNIEETIALIHTPPDDDWDMENSEEGFSYPENNAEIAENTVNERT